jgi:hypothetical protein
MEISKRLDLDTYSAEAQVSFSEEDWPLPRHKKWSPEMKSTRKLQIMTWNGMNESIIVHICTHYHNKFITYIIYIYKLYKYREREAICWIIARQQVAELTTAPSAQLACNYHQGKHETCAQHRHETGRKSPSTALCQVLGFKKLQDQDSNHKADRIAPLFKVKYVKWFKCHRKAPAEIDTCHGTLRKSSNRTQLAVST